MDIGVLFTGAGLLSLLTLTVLEIVLGIDNIIFISIVSSRLPSEQQGKARMIGLTMALLIRIGLLFVISTILQFQKPLFTLHIGDFSPEMQQISIRDLILIAGGFFLLTKSTGEIHEKLEGEDGQKKVKSMSLTSAIIQIVILDTVFSIDSILTAIGIGEDLSVMILSVIISLIVMMVFSGKISAFVNNHPTVKMLALAFLLMIGFLLVTEGLGFHVPKGYAYFAMAFSFGVEMLNLRVRKASKPVKLHNNYEDNEAPVPPAQAKG